MYICDPCSRRRRKDIADNTLVDGRMALIRIAWVRLDNMPRQGLHASTMITNLILTIPILQLLKHVCNLKYIPKAHTDVAEASIGMS